MRVISFMVAHVILAAEEPKHHEPTACRLSTIDIQSIMIKSFKCSDTQHLFETGKSSKWSAIVKVATRKLTQLDAAATLDFLRSPPGNRLELLKGDRAGQYSIRINEQWRLCFHWHDGNAWDVEIVDYH